MADSFKEHISKYSLKELLEAESSLDKASFPEKYAILQDEISKRRTAGEYVSQAYACPSCRRLTISHCDKIGGINKCNECRERLYLDPYRSSIASLIGVIGFGLCGVFESLWYLLIGLILMFVLRDKWVAFVSKETHTFRMATFNFIGLTVAGLISLSFALWSIFTDHSQVPEPRRVFIVLMTVATILACGFAYHYYQKRQRLKD